jgi:hypothetical protein
MWPAALLLAASLAAEPRWVHAGSAAGVHWYTRARVGSEVNELKVTALLDATPDEAWVIAWKAAAPERDVARPVAPGVVRLRVNEGEWRLEPREAGAKTFLTYRLLSAPGGSVPPFFVNRANTLGVPQTIESLRRAIEARRKR